MQDPNVDWSKYSQRLVAGRRERSSDETTWEISFPRSRCYRLTVRFKSARGIYPTIGISRRAQNRTSGVEAGTEIDRRGAGGRSGRDASRPGLPLDALACMTEHAQAGPTM